MTVGAAVGAALREGEEKVRTAIVRGNPLSDSSRCREPVVVAAETRLAIWGWMVGQQGEEQYGEERERVGCGMKRMGVCDSE